MTKNKRFTITQDFEEHHRQIRDNGYILMGCFVERQAEVIVDVLNQLNDENEQLKQENKKIIDTINNKITEKDMNWYKAEDNSKEEKEANLQLNVLEEVKEEIIEAMEEQEND